MVLLDIYISEKQIHIYRVLVFFCIRGVRLVYFLAILSGVTVLDDGHVFPGFKVPKLCLLSFFFIAQMM